MERGGHEKKILIWNDVNNIKYRLLIDLVKLKNRRTYIVQNVSIQFISIKYKNMYLFVTKRLCYGRY